MNTDEWNRRPRSISVVVDNDSWILPYAEKLVQNINSNGDKARLCRTHEEVGEGIAAFYLGCVKITPPDILKRNAYNLVVHESDLPKGRGFAPMSWQILEGVNDIPIVLIEAAAEADAGRIYLRDTIKLQGHELAHVWRDMQGRKTIELCLAFLDNAEPPVGKEQQGSPTAYKRRTAKDSELDPARSLADQINHLRICDNERYPAFFHHMGHKYIVKIFKEDEDI